MNSQSLQSFQEPIILLKNNSSQPAKGLKVHKEYSILSLPDILPFLFIIVQDFEVGFEEYVPVTLNANALQDFRHYFQLHLSRLPAKPKEIVLHLVPLVWLEKDAERHVLCSVELPLHVDCVQSSLQHCDWVFEAELW